MPDLTCHSCAPALLDRLAAATADGRARVGVAGASIGDADGVPAVAGPVHPLSCVGNTVRDGNGRAIGVVAGKRGGLAPGGWAPQFLGVEIPDAVAERLAPDDRVVVETIGRGLKLDGWPDIELVNLSPRLLDALPLAERGGALSCEVRAIVPPTMAGAGLGSDPWIGDLEIAGEARGHGRPDRLRFGDLVAFESIDGRVSRFYRPGMLSIGLVSHGPSRAPGHGIGVTLLMSGPAERLAAVFGETGSVGAILRRGAEEAGSRSTAQFGHETVEANA